MARFGMTTRLSPDEVMTRAERHFGPAGAGLQLTDRRSSLATWEGGGGLITVSVSRKGKKTAVDIASREWDREARSFLRELRGGLWKLLGP